MRHVFAVGLCFMLSSLSAQQVIFEENFNNGIPATWSIVNADNLVPATAVDTFTNAWIKFTTATDTCAASTSYYNPTGQAADYLITPKISLNLFTKLVWNARSYDASYADDYVVLISGTDSLISSFVDTLLVVEAEYYYWHSRSAQIDLEGFANQDVYIAFKNITNDGYILMIDDVRVMGSNFASTSELETPQVSVYPNPTASILNFSGVSTESVIEIYATDGSLIMTTSDTKVDISALPVGLYVYRITSPTHISSGTFSKI